MGLTMMDIILNELTKTYGLDWITMFFAVMSAYLLTQKDKRGIVCNIIACVSSFSLALLSHQYGFLISNLITMAIMMRAYMRWSHEEE